MKYLVLLLFLVLSNGSEQDIQKKFKVGLHSHQKKSHHTNVVQHAREKRTSSTTVVEDPIVVLKPDMTSVPAAKILEWFFSWPMIRESSVGTRMFRFSILYDECC